MAETADGRIVVTGAPNGVLTHSAIDSRPRAEPVEQPSPFAETSTMTDPHGRLSVLQVSSILQRAAENDARGDTLAVAELRRIAPEAGIDAGPGDGP